MRRISGSGLTLALLLALVGAAPGAPHGPKAAYGATVVEQPPIVSRAGWGANEELRFDAEGVEKWPATYEPVRKLVVHHTAGANDDPDPQRTVRSIYFYQAITRGWGDIGYNFLIDEQGVIYEGRWSRDYGPDEVPTGTDIDGRGVVGAHVGGWNSGTLGIALLGMLTEHDATPQARDALAWLLAWLAQLHDIDPLGADPYVHPISGAQKQVDNISGHRDWAATLCPGGEFHSHMPDLRRAVAILMGMEPPDPPEVSVPEAPSLTAHTPKSRPGVRLRWAAPADGGSAVTGYRIFRIRRGELVRVARLGPSATTWRDTNTMPGRSYTYAIRAVNAVGPGPLSERVSAIAR